MIQKSKGILIVLSGFSGSGKGTIMKELMKKYSEQYALSISATTRSSPYTHNEAVSSHARSCGHKRWETR